MNRFLCSLISGFLFFSAPLCSQNKSASRPPDPLRSIKQLTQNGDWKTAESELRTFLQKNPFSAEALVLHGMALVQLGLPFDAVMEVEEFLKTTPDSLPVLKLYAELLSAFVNDKLKAEEILLRCSRLKPSDVEIWKALGNLYLTQGKNAEAVRCFESAIKLAPRNPALIASLAYGQGRLGQSEKAHENFKQALAFAEASSNPHPVVYLLEGEYLLSLNKTTEALPALTKALLLDPHSADAYVWRGLCFEKLGDLKRAEADARAAIRESEKRRDAYQILLRVYKAQNQPDKIRDISERLQTLDEEEYGRLSLGRSLREQLRVAEPLLQQGKFAEAVPHYEEIVKILPSFYEAYFALGMCYSQLNRLPEAEKEFRTYLELQPLSADGNAALGTLLVQQARRKEAKPFLLQALKLDPGQLEVRKTLAQVYIAESNHQSAVRELEKILEVEPKSDLELYLLLARSYLVVPDELKATESLNRGLRLFPNSVDYWRGLVRLLYDYHPRGPQTEESMNDLVRRFPRDAGARTLHADWACNRFDYALCQEEVNAALALAPNDVLRIRLLTLSATIEDSKGNANAADAQFRESYALNLKMQLPDQKSAMAYIEFLERAQRDEEAQKYIDDILKIAPGLGSAHFSRAKYLSKTRQYPKALEEANLAMVAAGSNPFLLQSIHAFLARTYFAMGKPGEAEKHQKWIEENVKK